MISTSLLLIEQTPAPPETLHELLKQLVAEFGLDSYQCRQRLIGQGVSVLARGVQDKLLSLSPVLQQAGFKHWIFAPSQPLFPPRRIHGLEVGAETVRFDCQRKTVELHKGTRVLAVLADLSGLLAEKSVKQLLLSHAYRGRDHIQHLTKEKTLKVILQGQPVLDLYLLDAEGQVEGAVRIFPGKFDPQGLGERATLSSRQNLKQVLLLAKDYASEFHLRSDFGLVDLPGCRPRMEDKKTPEMLRQNLISLTRYGWLQADLLRHEPICAAAKGINPGPLNATTWGHSPGLLAGDQTHEVSLAAETLARELDGGESSPVVDRSTAATEPGLPTPPAARMGNRWTRLSFWLGGAGSLVAVLVLFFHATDNHLLRQIVREAFACGVLPLIVASLCFWAGFSFLRLKRQIENTPTSRTRSVAMGMVEVRGRALRKYALIAPMSHVPCVFYRLTRYRREKNNQWRVSRVTSSDNVPFMLEDETGRIEIDPAGCRVRAGTRHEGSPGQAGLMRREDSDDKWVEEVIVEGSLLYVLGFAAGKPDLSTSLNERKLEALRELKRKPEDLQRFDNDGDGHICAEEWDAAREAIAEDVLHDSLAAKGERRKQEEKIVIGKRPGRPLVIAETPSEEQLTGHLALSTAGLLVVAVAASVWGLKMLVNYLN